MSALKQLSPKQALGVGALAVVLVLAAGWFLLIAPKRSEATTLEQDVAAKQVELANRRAELAQPSAEVKVRASDLYRLTKALPNTTDMSGILLDVDRLASQNELAFRSITPGSAQMGASALSLPITVVVQGRFTSVSRFLRDVRTLVRVRDGRLDARGRVYSVTQVDLGAPETATFPVVKATITLNAHAYVAPASGAGRPEPTTPSSDGTVAAGVTP